MKIKVFGRKTRKNYFLKKLKSIIVSIFFVFSISPLILLGQEENAVRDYSPDDINMMLYGNSDELINGKIYLLPHPLAEGNPYFDNRSKINGTIFIKGNKYPGQVFGYNIADEKVILSAFQRNGAQFEVELNEALIDSMFLDNTLFVNGSTKIIPGFDRGFIEVIYKGNFLFIKKHKKIFMNQYASSSPYGFYTKDLGNFYLINDSIPLQISSIKSLLKEFETQRKEIKKYMKSVKFNFKKANNLQWVNLLLHCDKISSGKNE